MEFLDNCLSLIDIDPVEVDDEIHEHIAAVEEGGDEALHKHLAAVEEGGDGEVHERLAAI